MKKTLAYIDIDELLKIKNLIKVLYHQMKCQDIFIKACTRIGLSDTDLERLKMLEVERILDRLLREIKSKNDEHDRIKCLRIENEIKQIIKELKNEKD